LQAMLSLSGILFPIIKCKMGAELGRHACKPGLQLSWSYIIYFVAIAAVFCTSIVALHLNQPMDEEEGSSLYIISVVVAIGT
jgi:hypothetical protein